jgi:hypothetical protein
MEKFVIKGKNTNDDIRNNDDEYDDYSDTSSFVSDDNSIEDSEDLSNTGVKDAVDPLTFFSSKELCYYKTIHKFFKNCSDKEIIRMLDIINGESTISLRVLDWFVTRYSKRKIEFSEEENTLESFDVHISYKSELKSYKKRYFDPFRRRRKFYYPFYLESGSYSSRNSTESAQSHQSINSKEVVLLYTTLGQLNFFMWAISNKIIDYVEKNIEAISKAMNTNNKDEKKKKQKISVYKKKDKDTKEVKETKVKGKSETKNTNNVFNNYYEEEETELILDFD